MNTSLLTGLAVEWRSEAEILRRRAATGLADLLDSVAEDLDARVREWETQELSISEAAEESGYSEDHLRELVRTGRLPDTREPASQGRIVIRRADLPRKLPAEIASTSDVVAEMAMELLR